MVKLRDATTVTPEMTTGPAQEVRMILGEGLRMTGEQNLGIILTDIAQTIKAAGTLRKEPMALATAETIKVLSQTQITIEELELQATAETTISPAVGDMTMILLPLMTRITRAKRRMPRPTAVVTTATRTLLQRPITRVTTIPLTLVLLPLPKRELMLKQAKIEVMAA